LLFFIQFVTGVTFYWQAAGMDLRSALLQVVLTVSTLGGDTRPDILHTPRAEWFDIFFIATIILVALWGVSLLVEAIVRGELMYYWGTRRMEQRIAQLNDHYIICGFGRMGQEIARQLTRARQPFAVIEHNPNQANNLEMSGYPYNTGDAREDDQLLHIGIERAKGLIAVAATDEENVYITLSARVLNPNLYIVTRCSHASGEAKMLRAGANRVFSPYVIGGRRMAQAVLRPSVVDFLDTVVHDESMELVLEEVTLGPYAPIIGQPICKTSDVECLGVHLLGVATADGRMLMRDLDSYQAQTGDILILLGEPTAMQAAIKQLTGEDKVLFGMP
jgi:voltage-gated potassium channel